MQQVQRERHGRSTGLTDPDTAVGLQPKGGPKRCGFGSNLDVEDGKRQHMEERFVVKYSNGLGQQGS